MHEDPEGGDVEEEEVGHGLGERNVDEPAGGNNKDDCNCGVMEMHVLIAQTLTARASGVCPVTHPVGHSGSHRLKNLRFNYDLYVDFEYSDKIRVSPFMVTVLSFSA